MENVRRLARRACFSGAYGFGRHSCGPYGCSALSERAQEASLTLKVTKSLILDIYNRHPQA